MLLSLATVHTETGSPLKIRYLNREASIKYTNKQARLEISLHTTQFNILNGTLKTDTRATPNLSQSRVVLPVSSNRPRTLPRLDSIQDHLINSLQTLVLGLMDHCENEDRSSQKSGCKNIPELESDGLGDERREECNQEIKDPVRCR